MINCDNKCNRCSAPFVIITPGVTRHIPMYYSTVDTCRIYSRLEAYIEAGEDKFNYLILCNDCVEKLKEAEYQRIRIARMLAEKQEELDEAIDDWLENAIITTTDKIDGQIVVNYLGPLIAQVHISDKSNYTDDEFTDSKETILRKLCKEAIELEANAIIGMNIDVKHVNGSIILLGAGTAVLTKTNGSEKLFAGKDINLPYSDDSKTGPPEQVAIRDKAAYADNRQSELTHSEEILAKSKSGRKWQIFRLLGVTMGLAFVISLLDGGYFRDALVSALSSGLIGPLIGCVIGLITSKISKDAILSERVTWAASVSVTLMLIALVKD